MDNLVPKAVLLQGSCTHYVFGGFKVIELRTWLAMTYGLLLKASLWDST